VCRGPRRIVPSPAVRRRSARTALNCEIGTNEVAAASLRHHSAADTDPTDVRLSRA